MTGIIGKISSRSKIVNEPLTDGGILLGSGADAITATAALADSEMLVGDGTTDPAIESGATLRTSIGLGNVTNESKSTMFSSPTFSGTVGGLGTPAINLGSATGVIPVGVTGGGGIRSILQVKTTQTGYTVSTNNNSLGTGAYEIAELTNTFTVASTSKVLITGMLHVGHRESYTGRGYITYNHSGISETVIKNNINSYGCTIQFNHGADSTTSMQSPTPINLMFAPATANALTIKLKVMTSSTSYPTTFNRDVDNTVGSNDGGNTISSWTFWEIGTAISPTVTNVSSIDT